MGRLARSEAFFFISNFLSRFITLGLLFILYFYSLPLINPTLITPLLSLSNPASVAQERVQIWRLRGDITHILGVKKGARIKRKKKSDRN